MTHIDLNCDVGESYGVWPMGQDAAIMPYVSSCNIACGAHAGDPNVMAATVVLAKTHNVAVGAHPGYPDLAGFGRRPMALTRDEVKRCVLAQVGALWAIARSEGVDLRHLKAHGALYNVAATERSVAEAVASAVAAFSSSLALVCLAGSEMERAGLDQKLNIIREGFTDRAYDPSGLLADRKTPNAVHSSPARAVQQALELARGSVTCQDGSTLRLRVDTICLHSDTPGAAEIARGIHGALLAAGYTIAPWRREG